MLEVRGLRAGYGRAQVLFDVDLDAAAAAIHHDQRQSQRGDGFRVQDQRAGALKVSDHWVQPAPQYQPRGQICHGVSEQEGQGRVLTIQDRHHALLQRAAKATTGAGPRRGHRLRAPGAARGGPRRARAQVAATLTAPLPLERRASHFGTLSPPRGEGRGRGEWLLLWPSIRREQRPGEPGADPGRLD